MFEAKSMLFLTVETPLHAGTGRGLGTVDLPIQRERTTGYPMVQASSLKGRFRAHYRNAWSKDDLAAVFGPETDNAAEHAGALAVGDARILLFPVRSLAGVFAWVTSRDVLARFLRDAELAGISIGVSLPQAEPAGDKAWASSGTILAGNDPNKKIVLEEFSFAREENSEISAIAEKLSELVFPASYDGYWKKSLKEKLCILPQDAFRDFVLYGTEVQTHIALNPETKTVDKEKGALWTSESLPVDTILYAPVMATRSRLKRHDLNADTVLSKVTNDKDLTHINLGGDETTGQGIVGLKFGG